MRTEQTEAREILEQLRQSTETWRVHFLNAQNHHYNAYWVAVLMLGAERTDDPRQFLVDFLLGQIDKDRKLRWPGFVAEEILKASR